MNKFLLTLLFPVVYSVQGQSVVQSVNSGSIITNATSVSVGEIVVVPVNQSQSASGIIGILAQNSQQLEIPEFQTALNVVVYPNPTTAALHFKSSESLQGERLNVLGVTGQSVLQTTLDSSGQIDLSGLQTGIYLLQFENKKFKSFKIVKH